MRVGFGYDVHRLVSSRKLILGGVEIPFEKGLAGYSDADVLCHAVGDALLGAAALGDLGHYFPSGHPEYQNISSLIILQEIKKLLERSQQKIVNIDATIVAEKPQLRQFIDQMRQNVADVLHINIQQVSIKSKTADGLGFIGTSQAIAAYVISMITDE